VFRVTFPHLGAEVVVDTLEELRQVVDALGTQTTVRLEMRPARGTLERQYDEARAGEPETPLPTRRKTRPQAPRDRTVQTNTPDLERGILAVLSSGSLSGHAIAKAAGVAQVTITRYLRTLERAGKVHRQGAGRMTKWALGKRPKEAP